MGERFAFGVSLTRGKTFDLRVTENGVDHDFSQLERSTLSPLYTFLEQTGVPIANAEEVTRQLASGPRRPVKEGLDTRAPITDAADEQGDGYNEDLDEDFQEESSAGEEESSDEDEEEEAPRR